MATSAFIGSQSLVQLGNGASPEVFTTIGEVTTFGGLGQRNDLIEATHLLSLAKEYVYGLADGLEIPVELNYVPTNAQQIAALAAQAAKTTKNFKYVLPITAPNTFAFAALILAWNIGPTTPNGITKLNLTLKISGTVTGPT